ncbi:hypothetical protein D3C79_541430 [compost metagenome]
MSVVERLEVVEVDQQGDQRFGFALGFLQGLRGQQVETAAVGQAGEAVEGGQGLDVVLMALDHGIEQRQHHQGDHRADRQVQVQRLANGVHGAVFALVDEQVPVQLRHQAHVEEMAVAVAAAVLVAAADRLGHLPEPVQFDQRLPGPGTVGPAVRAGQHDEPLLVDEEHLALVALLIVIDQADHRFDRQADTGNADELAVVIEHPVVDEYREAVLIGHVEVDVDLVGRVHFQHPLVPGIPRFLWVDLLQYAFGLVVDTRVAGDEERRVGLVLAHDFAQVSGDLGGVALAAQGPVAQEGVVGHHRRDQDRPHEVLLDFRIDRVGGQRQLGVDDAVADRAA